MSKLHAVELFTNLHDQRRTRTNAKRVLTLRTNEKPAIWGDRNPPHRGIKSSLSFGNSHFPTIRFHTGSPQAFFSLNRISRPRFWGISHTRRFRERISTISMRLRGEIKLIFPTTRNLFPPEKLRGRRHQHNLASMRPVSMPGNIAPISAPCKFLVLNERNACKLFRFPNRSVYLDAAKWRFGHFATSFKLKNGSRLKYSFRTIVLVFAY